MISIEKRMLLTSFQKLPNNVGNLDELIVAERLSKLAQSPINRPIWSHWYQASDFCIPGTG